MQQVNLEGKIFGYDKKTLLIVAVVVILLGGSFYAGAKYEKSKLTKLGLLKNATVANTSAKKVKLPAADTNVNTEKAATISGSITAKDTKSVTIKTTDNLTQIISITDTTAIGASGKGVLADLTIGEKVTANGTKNSDGSFSAKDIQPANATTTATPTAPVASGK